MLPRKADKEAILWRRSSSIPPERRCCRGARMTAARGSTIFTRGQAFLAKLRLAPGGILLPLALTVALPLALLMLPSRAMAQSSTPPLVSAQANPQLFATMCALYAAGFEADVSSDTANPVMTQLRSALLALNGPAAQALRKYYRDHELSDPAQNMSRYVTFGLVVGPAPEVRLHAGA